MDLYTQEGYEQFTDQARLSQKQRQALEALLGLTPDCIPISRTQLAQALQLPVGQIRWMERQAWGAIFRCGRMVGEFGDD